MDFEDLTPEQQEKVRACKTPEDMLALAKAEGYELSDEELAAVNGGINWECWDVSACTIVCAEDLRAHCLCHGLDRISFFIGISV